MTDSFARWLVDPSGLTPHGFCLLWQPGLVWTYAASDLVVGAAYFSIPLALAVVLRRRRDLVFRPLFWLAAAFILLCGVTHWLDLLTLWVPAYGAQALAKAATAAVSAVMAVALWRLLPQVLALPSPAQMREAHDALVQSERFLDRIGRAAGIGGWSLDLRSREVYWSPEVFRLHGLEPGPSPTLEEALDFFAPESRPVVSAAVERAVARGEGWDLELRLTRADGRPMWARAVGVVDFEGGEAVRVVGSFQETTRRVAELEELREAHERFTLATDCSRIGIWDWDVATDRLVWDDWMCRLYGLEPGGGRQSYEEWARFVHPDDRPAVERALRDALGGGTPFETEFRVVWRDGGVHHLRAFARVARDAAGNAARVVGANWDITEPRRLAAEARRQAELRAEAAELETALFLNSPDSLFVVRVEGEPDDPTFVYETFSPAFEAMTGMRRADVVGRGPEAVSSAEVAAEVMSRYRRCVAERATIRYAAIYALPVGTRDFEGSITPVLNVATDAVVRLVGTMRDVTERNRMEQALRHAQKMEAIGRLSAGVAHDFNNILQSIVGGLELVLEEIDQKTPAHQLTNVAINSAMRGASLTHHLLSYARKQTLRPQAVEVAQLLADLGTLLARTLGPQVDIRVRAERVPPALADPGQLQTALLNLAINAAHAMPQGGVLSLDARAEADAGRGWVLLAVTDTGVGMDEATLAQAADPFFSTKGLDGSGLGLSMVQGFAEQSGGGFRISSAPGEGTTVELRLPAAAPDHRTVRPERFEARPASGRILLVDDGADVLATTGALLEKAGFVVVCADSGDRARDMLAAGERFDALVSDYAMPGLSGADLIVEAQTLQPGLRALLITGYASAGYAGTLPEGTPVLHKPFQRNDLLAALRQVMERDRSTV